MKILILVANSNQYPSSTIVPFLKRTWGKDKRVRTIFYQGGETKDSFKNNILKLNIPSSQEFVNEKGLKAFEWILENIEFDVVFRCTTTIYLNIDNLINFLDDKKMINFYSGVTHTFPHYEVPEEDKLLFLSGAGCFFSRDVVQKLIDNKNQYDFSLNDDVAIGKLLVRNLGVPIQDARYQDFLYGYPAFNNIDFTHYHYRFKLGNTSLKLHYPRFLEVLILLSLHIKIKYIKNEKKSTKFLYLLMDYFLPLVFELLRYLNPLFYIVKMKEFKIKFNKVIVLIIKSNFLSIKVFQYLKRISKFKGFK